MSTDIGLCFHREFAAGAVIEHAHTAESLGFDEFWVIEDCFFTSGPTLAAAALTATDHIGVGIGIMPAVARTAAITAMEIATLAGLAPGRFHAGIGHGVQTWMAQMGARKASPLTALEETILAVRELLAGDRITRDGRYVTLDDVALEAPPHTAPLVSAGVQSTKSLQLAGRAADGTILAELCSPTYLRWVKEQIAVGAAEVGRSGEPHRMTIFASMVIDDGDAARAAATPFVASVLAHPHMGLRMLDFYDELADRAAASSWEEAVGAMPKSWWAQLGAFGTLDDAAAYVMSMTEAGVDAIAFFPGPFDPLGAAAQLAEQVLPRTR
ncbi:MAG: LLM class flavin-dependent oxidoreductase [Acidimicrobiales bacterium]